MGKYNYRNFLNKPVIVGLKRGIGKRGYKVFVGKLNNICVTGLEIKRSTNFCIVNKLAVEQNPKFWIRKLRGKDFIFRLSDEYVKTP